MENLLRTPELSMKGVVFVTSKIILFYLSLVFGKHIDTPE